MEAFVHVCLKVLIIEIIILANLLLALHYYFEL